MTVAESCNQPLHAQMISQSQTFLKQGQEELIGISINEISSVTVEQSKFYFRVRAAPTSSQTGSQHSSIGLSVDSLANWSYCISFCRSRTTRIAHLIKTSTDRKSMLKKTPVVLFTKRRPCRSLGAALQYSNNYSDWMRSISILNIKHIPSLLDLQRVFDCLKMAKTIRHHGAWIFKGLDVAGMNREMTKYEGKQRLRTYVCHNRHS